jgi:hypothetical protein
MSGLENPRDFTDQRPWTQFSWSDCGKELPDAEVEELVNATPRALSEGERIRYADTQIAWRRPLGLGDRGAAC